ncbi:hypothetical protein TNCV_4895231 [Trichonephila clavipes]|nr:hypothetical protein TNCV_4895231 [Trichonephila clavipes]
MVVIGTEQQHFFQELGMIAITLETLPKPKDIYDGNFSQLLAGGGAQERSILHHVYQDWNVCNDPWQETLKKRFSRYHDRCQTILIQSIHVTQQSTKGERSASRDILTQKQYVSSGLFLPCQSVSTFWPTCPHRTVDCQHSRGWQRSRSDLPHGGPLEPPHDSQT